MEQSIWEIAPKPALEITAKMSAELDMPKVVCNILINRGMSNVIDANRFLFPKMSELCDPYLFEDMDRGVERVIEALRNREKIMIYGDYDVDGITATSLMFLVLNKLGAEVSYYLPNRLSEGYGISEDGLAEAKRRGVSLLISVDCGITAVGEVKIASEMGIDCIITDHHEPGSEIPQAIAVINPKRNGSEGIGVELSGVGIAFKFASAIYERLNQDPADVREHLDLVALGTAADIVPLVNENRILTKFGIKQVSRTSKPGLKALIFVSGLMGKEIGTGQVVFILAPRINAIGRLGNAELAIKLLSTKDERQASTIARRLNEENHRRKEIDEKTLHEALDQIREKVDLDRDKAIVLAGNDWHQGVIGIVASRLVERYHRPTVMISIDGDEGKGSARSIPNFHLYDALRECENLLIRFGGHKYAAGLSINVDMIEKFRQRFNEVASRMLGIEDMSPKVLIDADIEFDEIDEKLIDAIDMFSPFGPQNMKPVFMTRNVELYGNPYIVGNNHLKLKVQKDDRIFDCIGFGLGGYLSQLFSQPLRLNIAYLIEMNDWNGVEHIQLRIKDLQVL
ncbi:MAG: single-stranded-DNA-specific exonuclease RecJ [candidate division Zixibacteria bacterium CG_4_9_14_3_um_filter_46_8]|nr:MAG: single-stranded-DNA-specific exonuclease RecJ [candidate division Zixibacteria bacterium CG_4_9_14_3_um_filter_46_8]